MALGSYSYATLAQVRSQLRDLLDANFWTDAELNIYIVESIRTFGGLSRFFRQRASFSLTAGTPFYDLTALVPSRSFNVTSQSLVLAAQYHLLEPPTSPTWTGTDMFDLTQAADSLTRRTNQFLLETSCTLSTSQQTAAAASRIALDDTVIDVRHANWQDQSGTWTSMWEEDEWSIDAAANSAAAQAAQPAPTIYSVTETPVLSLRVAPTPQNAGTLELVTISAAPNFDPPSGATVPIPDDFCWVVKWGMLADMLSSEGQASDAQRMKYCQARYQEGIIAARAASSMMDVQLNGAPFWLDAYTRMQAAIPGWRNTEEQPSIAAMLGLNVLAFGPVPDSAYGVSGDVVVNATVPSADTDFIAVGREELDVILAYARHLACFKLGGSEFMETLDGWQRMVKLAVRMNAGLRAHSRDLVALRDPALLDRQFHPDQQPEPQETVAT